MNTNTDINPTADVSQNHAKLIDNAVAAIIKCGCQYNSMSLEWHKNDILRYIHEPDTQWCTRADNDAAIAAIDKCIAAGLGDAMCISSEQRMDDEIERMESLIQEQIDDASDQLSSRVKTQERLDSLVIAHRMMNEVLTALL